MASKLRIWNRECQRYEYICVHENEEECRGGILQIDSITLVSTGWSLVSGLYEYDYTNENITTDSIVDVIPDNEDIEIVQAAEIYPKTVSSAGSVKLYAKNAPTDDIGVTINISTKQ